MNLRVAVQARPVTVKGGIRFSGNRLVATLNMTLLAEHRRTLAQQADVVRAVRFMTVRTVFSDRRMLEKIRSAIFRMTVVTGFVNAAGAHHFFADRTVRFMAGRAGNALFAVFVAEKVRRALKHTLAHIRVTRETSVRFRSEFQKFSLRLNRIKGQREKIAFARFLSAWMMWRVTTDAGQTG